MDIVVEHEIAPSKVVVDHNNEETVQEVLDRGFWAAFTIYPNTKMGNERMVEIVKRYGPERIIVDSAADWGVSDPLAVPKTARLMVERGVAADAIRAVTYGNALAAYGQSGQIREADWEQGPIVDQRQKFEGSGVLRGGQEPRVGNIIE
jgi:predicted metal-dependent TIM-barrel fold hydrolase